MREARPPGRQVLADYFPVMAHNQSMNKVQRTGTFYSLFPGPFFLVSFLLFFSLKSADPHPPSLWKSFFNHFIPRNLHEINSLNFYPVDESVTVNLDLCPNLTPKRADSTPKCPLFRRISHTQLASEHPRDNGRMALGGESKVQLHALIAIPSTAP
jgi:hypothetical protein